MKQLVTHGQPSRMKCDDKMEPINLKDKEAFKKEWRGMDNLVDNKTYLLINTASVEPGNSVTEHQVGSTVTPEVVFGENIFGVGCGEVISMGSKNVLRVSADLLHYRPRQIAQRPVSSGLELPDRQDERQTEPGDKGVDFSRVDHAPLVGKGVLLPHRRRHTLQQRRLRSGLSLEVSLQRPMRPDGTGGRVPLVPRVHSCPFHESYPIAFVIAR